MGHHVLKDFLRVFDGGILKKPSIAFLHQVIGVGQQAISYLKDIWQEQPLFGGYDEGDSGSPPEPAVVRFRLLLQVIDKLRELSHKRTYGMITHGVAFSPVIDIEMKPFFKHGKVAGFVFPV